MMIKLLTIIFFTFLTYGLIVTIVESCLMGINFGDLVPNEANVEVGEELSFNCTLKKEFVDNGEIDISRVFFARNEIIIDQRFVTIIDPYTVRLSIKNTSPDDFGNYSCKFNDTNGETLPICYSDDKPLNVSDFECIFHYRQKLSCSWTLPNNRIETKYTLHNYHEGLEIEKRDCGNVYIENNKQHCFWNTSHDLSLHNNHYFLELLGSNKIGTNNQTFIFDQTSITQLPPPRMKPKYEQFVDGHLQWIAPENLLLDETLKNRILYRISVFDMNNKTIRMIDFNPNDYNKKISRLSNTVSLDMKDLRPFTQYRFNISCKVDDPNNQYWSDMISFDVLSEPKIPETSPMIINQSFETLSVNLSENERKVVIYWKPLANEEQNGPDFEYFISYSAVDEPDYWINQTTLYPNLTLTLSSNVSYLFNIFSKNSVGLSDNYSLFVLPATREILWNNASNILNSMINVFLFPNGSYKLNWTSIDDSLIKDYTLFWCLATNGQCLNQVQWKSMSEKQSLLHLPDYEYKFGIAFNSHNQQTTGIIWAKCLVNMKTKKIDGVIITNVMAENVTSDSAIIKWKLTCGVHRTLIDRFEIRYWKNTKSNEYISKVVHKDKNQYSLTDLKDDTEYKLIILVVLIGSPYPYQQNNPIDLHTLVGLPSHDGFSNQTKSSNSGLTSPNRFLLFIISFISFIILLCFVLFCTYRTFKSVKQKNDEFTINFSMEDQSFKDQFQAKFGSNQNSNRNNMLPEQSTQKSPYRETNIDNVSNNNVSESSLMESDLTMANTATNANSSNTINDQALLSSSGEAEQNILLINHSNNQINNDQQQNDNSRNNSKNLTKNSYIKLSSNQFCSSDSGVSDMNHHDNLEYFYNQDESLREPFLPNGKKSTQIISNGHAPMNNGGVSKGIGSFWSRFSSSTAAAAAAATSLTTPATATSASNSTHSAPSSSLPSPEHNHVVCSSRTPMFSSQNQQSSPMTTTNINNNNGSVAKTAYVMIPSSNSPKCLPPSHTTQLPQSYNLNQV
uniref:Cytokine receptor-like isoform X2 n=1 Tax=Dermatophagoides pteronyssinus TaxID=6956 RepID=A0A6P6Y0M6_DERPT|nr:cytokine receptor-like isoform X2 [Dermatophagoides pteronyssinus]